jgi:uncharacterized oxidoreductase
MKLEGHTVLITGGSSGIGLELAKQLKMRGNTVVITGRDRAKLEKAKQRVPGLETIESDVSRVDAIEELHRKVLADFPTLDVLVNNAGIMRTVNLHKNVTDLEGFTGEIDVNLKGPVRMTTRFLPDLKKRPVAAVINVTSGLAFVPLPISPIYSATKAALHSYTLSLRAQLAKTQVKVFELAPPTTQTDLIGPFEAADLKGVSVMGVEEMVSTCLKGLADDRFEIRPGQSNQLKLMNRLAPEFILAQLSKPVARMLEN